MNYRVSEYRWNEQCQWTSLPPADCAADSALEAGEKVTGRRLSEVGRIDRLAVKVWWIDKQRFKAHATNYYFAD